jgi:hypothetical protein
MEKLEKFFITTLVAGMVTFSSIVVVPTQVTQALITTNQIEDNAITSPKIKDGEVKTPDIADSAVTKQKLNPNAVTLVMAERMTNFVVPAHSLKYDTAKCNVGEVVTGGGFVASGAFKGAVVTQSVPLINVNGWGVVAYNPDTVEHSAQVHVVCAHLALGP